jgi:hypothetical protein
LTFRNPAVFLAEERSSVLEVLDLKICERIGSDDRHKQDVPLNFFEATALQK